MPSVSALDLVHLWIFGRRFFVSTQFSPPFRLDWDQNDAWGNLVAFDWGVLNLTSPHRFFHEWSTTVSVVLCIGYEGVAGEVTQGFPGPLPQTCTNWLFWNWWLLDVPRLLNVHLCRPLHFVRFLNRVLPPRPIYHFHCRATLLLHTDSSQYPSEWTMEEIAHQHFLAYAVLSFWHIDVRGPPGWPIHLCWLRRVASTTPTDAMDSLLDWMTLEFETHMKNWKRAGKAERNNHDKRHKQELAEARDELLLFLLTMERVLLWLNRLGVWVAWSENYNLQMMHLYPDAFDSFPMAERRAEFDKFRANLFSSRRPLGEQSGITPLDAPIGHARLRLIPKEEDPHVQRESATVFSSEGVLSCLDQSATSSGLLLHEVEPAAPGYFLEGEELDVFLSESGLEPAGFLNATLPTPPTPSPTPPPRDPSPPPIEVLEEDFVPLPPLTPLAEQEWFHQIPSRGRHSEKRKRESYSARSKERPRKKTPTEPRADRGERPPTIKIPPSFGTRLPECDLSRPPQHFPSESFRAKGQWCAPCIPRASYASNETVSVHWIKIQLSPFPRRLRDAVFLVIRCMQLVRLGRISSSLLGNTTGQSSPGFVLGFGSIAGMGHISPQFWTRGEFLVGFRPLQSNLNVASHRRSKQRPKPTTIVISSDSEDDVPLGKRRKTLRQETDYVSSGEESGGRTMVDDMGNYELDDEDVLMPDAQIPIADNPANYDPELEPASAEIPLGQQASSSRVTLDDPPPDSVSSSHLPSFRLRSVDPMSSATTRDDYVEEIVEQVLSSSEDPH
ncbi:hypothetical protein C8R45DRAFT_1109835 [Mycena sanguinolenta]|nr:hypothetical protein C8R45DRAFT_1109835 [Mycena sanguinolenta]